MSQRLIRADHFAKLIADGYEVEGTGTYVLELLMFGFAYSSYFLLLHNRAILSRLDDEALCAEISCHPTRFGKRLDPGKELIPDGQGGWLLSDTSPGK